MTEEAVATIGRKGTEELKWESEDQDRYQSWYALPTRETLGATLNIYSHFRNNFNKFCHKIF